MTHDVSNALQTETEVVERYDEDLARDLEVALRGAKIDSCIARTVPAMAYSVRRRMDINVFGPLTGSIDRIIRRTASMILGTIDYPTPALQEELRDALSAEIARLAFKPEDSVTYRRERYKRALDTAAARGRGIDIGPLQQAHDVDDDGMARMLP